MAKKLKLDKSILMMMAVFGVTYVSYTVPYVVLVPYLTSLGYTGTEQGIITASGSLFGMVMTMVFGYLCDKFRTIKKFVYLSAALLAVATWVFYSRTNNVFFFHLIFGMFMQGFWMILQGLTDGWAMEENEACRDNYGSIRAFGAIGWIFGGPIVAWVAEQFGYQYLGLLFTILTLIAFAVEYFVPDADKKPSEKGEELKLSDVKKLIGDKKYLLLVLLFFLAFFVLQAESYLSIQKITRLNLDTAAKYTTLKSSFQAIFELPFFFLGGYLLKKFGAIKLLMVALVVYMARLGLDALATGQTQMVYISALQMLTFPLLAITSKTMIYDAAPAELKSSGMQFATSVYSTGSALIAPLLCGYLLDTFGANASLFGFVAVIIIPLALCVTYMKVYKN